ncbi:hypothetical protein Tco_1044024 [Tanacetum coccineum]|uniref:Uncharacterized protein n=1 Tax=Tanacetum coccineum TaxID=301880 RepID=A0ABQ5GPZ8_9ASTR
MAFSCCLRSIPIIYGILSIQLQSRVGTNSLSSLVLRHSSFLWVQSVRASPKGLSENWVEHIQIQEVFKLFFNGYHDLLDAYPSLRITIEKRFEKENVPLWA